MTTDVLNELAETIGERPRAAPLRRSDDRVAPLNTFWHAGKVTAERRSAHFGHAPATVWLTGLSGAGKSTIAYELDKMLHDEGRSSYVLDGDNLRHHLNRDLGFSPADRKENIRRTAEVAKMMNEAGLMVIAAFISPFREDRAMAAAIIGASEFIEVYVSTPTEVCEARDPKGLYAKARAGEIPAFTGVSSPYEVPLMPALVLDSGVMSLEDASRALYQHLALRFRSRK
ncbi:adenylyl-sulfate kinase [Janthinobacterium fluminis]|uniref:Adenylyl-sulfate kinase n=1 Tax=Janthinobacterium fluminis TaxID=2987524 RepID=A0ABT5JZR9_9BURK|nr:adenylyl-sulfate kinase [Janthinobacterium fluminis]MDC8758214.1 adenylyl-sulfate kinase [Janthinobacterium fluminis]